MSEKRSITVAKGNMYYMALEALDDAGEPLPPSQVRDLSDLEGQTANVALNRLYERGFVERQVVAVEGPPLYHYEITDEGRAALEGDDG